LRRSHANWHRVALRELLRGDADTPEALAILFGIGRKGICGWRVLRYGRITSNHRHVAAVGAVEVQCDAPIARHVPLPRGVTQAVDQDRLTVPVEPDRTWLRRAVTVDCDHPDHLFLAQAARHALSELSCCVDVHAASTLLANAHDCPTRNLAGGERLVGLVHLFEAVLARDYVLGPQHALAGKLQHTRHVAARARAVRADHTLRAPHQARDLERRRRRARGDA